MKDISPTVETLGVKKTPRWANLMCLVVLIAILDYSARFSVHPKLQYVIVVVPISYILLSNFERNQRDRLSSLCFISGFLWFFGMSGIYWGKIVERNTDGALPLIWPLAVLMFATYQIESNVDVKKGMVLLAHLSNIVALEGITARSIGISSTFNYSHEKAYLIFFAISVGVMFRKTIITLTGVLLLVGNFLVYPALTYLLCGISAIAVIRAFSGQYKVIRFCVFQVIAIAFLYYSTFQISQPGSILDKSYQVLNRKNNVGYREFLIEQVKNQISENIWFGSGFRRSVLVQTDGVNLPVHNDFVTVILGGGIVAFFLYISIYVITNHSVFSRINQILDYDSRQALICLTVLLNSYFFCSSANPISMKTQNGMILMSAIYSIKVILSSNEVNRKQLG
jgi:hypothetical protein